MTVMQGMSSLQLSIRRMEQVALDPPVVEKSAQEAGGVALLSASAVELEQGIAEVGLSTEAPELRKPALNASEGVAGKDQLRGAAWLAYLIAELNQVMDNVSDDQLKSNLDRFKQQRLSQNEQLDMDRKKAEEAEAAAKKAAEVTNCVTRLLGGLVAVLGVVGAVFTGGASLVLAGVGLAVLAADKITEAVTGKSLTGMVLGPVVQLFAELATKIGQFVGDCLRKLGVSEEVAQIVGSVIGAVAAAAVVLVVGFVAKGAAAQLTKAVVKGFGKLIPKLVAKVEEGLAATVGKITRQADKISQAAGRGARKVGVSDDPAVMGSNFKRGAAVGEVTSAGVNAGGKTWEGVSEKELDDALAEVVERLANLEVLQRLTSRSMVSWKDSQQQWDGAIQVMSDAVHDEMEAGIFIARNVRGMAQA